MPPLMDRKLRFSDAAYAIDATPKTLRNWLARGLVKLHTPKPEGGGWTEYSFADIAILALMRQFVSFGVDVPTASALANQVMLGFFPALTMGLRHPGKMPAAAMALMWTNRRLQVFPQGDSWELRVANLWETRGADATVPSEVAALRAEIEPCPVFLSIDVEKVLRTAFDRANESANEGVEDDE